MQIMSIALCIPAFKAENCLPALLDSALSQTVPFAEIIVCVDACPGQTAEVARRYNVRVIENATNLGCSESKNRALREVRSEWVHFHDADDLLLPNFVADAKAMIAKEPWVDVIAMGYEYRDAKSNDLICRSNYNIEELLVDPLRYCIANKIPNFCVYRACKLRELDGFDVDDKILYNEDYAFHLKLAVAGLRFTASEVITSINLKYENSMSASNQLKCLQCHKEVLMRAIASLHEKYPEELAEKLWNAATGLSVYSEWEAVKECLVRAKILRSKPPKSASRLMRILSTLVTAPRAFWLREQAIRIFKPKLRRSNSQ